MPVSQFHAILAAMFVLHLIEIMVLVNIVRQLERIEKAQEVKA